jgi:hypothetical protein
MTQSLQDIAKKFLAYSFKDIKFEYEQLTEEEKKLCTPDEFKALVEWIHQLTL